MFFLIYFVPYPQLSISNHERAFYWDKISVYLFEGERQYFIKFFHIVTRVSTNLHAGGISFVDEIHQIANILIVFHCVINQAVRLFFYRKCASFAKKKCNKKKSEHCIKLFENMNLI